jgi:hypothetical protein
MSIRSLMQPGAFDPEAIAAMSEALQAAYTELGDIGQSDSTRETIAGRIIAAARFGHRCLRQRKHLAVEYCHFLS